MTHDELLVLLNAKSDSDEVHALRAVVELHKPYLLCDCGECKATACQRCQAFEGSLDYYPCETIRAIEKELK